MTPRIDPPPVPAHLLLWHRLVAAVAPIIQLWHQMTAAVAPALSVGDRRGTQEVRPPHSTTGVSSSATAEDHAPSNAPAPEGSLSFLPQTDEHRRAAEGVVVPTLMELNFPEPTPPPRATAPPRAIRGSRYPPRYRPYPEPLRAAAASPASHRCRTRHALRADASGPARPWPFGRRFTPIPSLKHRRRFPLSQRLRHQLRGLENSFASSPPCTPGPYSPPSQSATSNEL